TTERTVRVAVTDDDLNEPSETLTLTLSNPVEATISGATGTGTIVDDDGLPSLTVDDVSVAEDSGTATFTITASKSYPADVTGSVDTRNGSAAAGSDYTAITDGTFLIPSGSTSTTVAVPVLDDEIDEGTTAETFEVVLSDAANATLSDGSGTATITDDDPSVSIGDVAAAEGDSGTTVLSLPITLSRPTSRAIGGKVDTADGTATAGSDYDAIAGGSFLVPAGATTATVDVTVRGDTTVEPDETFDVLLRAVNTSVADAGGRGTILNDDAPPPASGPAPGPAPAPAPGPAPAPAPAPAPPVVPVVSADPVELREGDSGTSPANFIVRLSQPTSQPVAVSYRTVEDTARDGTDYAGTAGALSFAPGETAKLVAVPVVGDTRAEADEVFGLVLGAPQNAALANPSVATATILDDDRVASSRRSRPKLSLSSTRYRDRRAPYSFRFRGRLTIPKGMSKARTCRRGRVTITVKRWNKRRVRSYNATLNSKCRYSRLVTLPRSTKRGALRVSARYAGSSQLLTATSKTRRFRGG
ncbi:Calx-beta domain-containing protein, partial [Paraconexibacter sp.]|uniref:Calx-beta domain-containing protein n=1 Tax=Paraconexibacter sp. TaxID=2949640 RepID=UPI003566737F